MVTGDTDVAELLSLVQSTGRKEEESTKYIDSMTELVKKGMRIAILNRGSFISQMIYIYKCFFIRYRNCDCRLKKRN